MRSEKVSLECLLALTLVVTSLARAEEIRDVRFFLHRLRTLDHMPELEASHTAMGSTWDRSGGNNDGVDFKRIEGTHNILLDVDGPGCIHRIFTGMLLKVVAETRIQILLDNADQPVFDMPVNEFFDDHDGPIPYPLVFHKTYPGTLFPIPFAKHCRVQLTNPKAHNWGNYWQVTYTQYAPGTKIKSLAWPLNEAENAELKAVCDAWRKAEHSAPEVPAKWSCSDDFAIPAGQNAVRKIDGPPGVIRQMRMAMEPVNADLIRQLHMQIRWDGETDPSVDVPLSDLTGWSAALRSPDARFNALIMGTAGDEAYFCMPMPYSSSAEIRIENRSKQDIQRLSLRLDIEKVAELPPNWGRLHAAWRQNPAGTPDLPHFGPKDVPTQLVLEQSARGKYVGVLLQVDWPWEHWWGEGDWLIWTDESAWPPSYHGTGSEEYFNSGWCLFDRKAISGYITEHPGWAAVYSFHLNDAFQFQKNIRVAEEMMGFGEAEKIIREKHPMWTSTAYWYAAAGNQRRP